MHDAILQRVCGKRCCIQLYDDARPELVELVSFTFDTIELGRMIVCGLPAHESDARRRLLRVLADTANQSVATHDSGCSLFPGLPAPY